MITVSITELRHDVGKIFDFLEAGSSVAIMKHGKEIAVLMPYGLYREILMAMAEELQEVTELATKG